MGAYLISMGHGFEWNNSVTIGELLLIKGIALPWLLVDRFNRAGVPRFIDLIPANLLHWTIAMFFVAFAYLAAAELVPNGDRDMMLVGAALSAVALGMLALSSQNELPGQLISVLTIENGVSLFTIGGNHETPWVLEIFVALDFLILVVLASNFLKKMPLAEPPRFDPDRSSADSTAQAPIATSMTTTDFGDVL